MDPPNEIVTATTLLYASLLISLLAAFVAMLGKQWLTRYLYHDGGSMIERYGDRQRQCDGLQKLPFRLFVETLPVMLLLALLLAYGLGKYMASINATVAGVLVALTQLGDLFYIGIVIVGASSYECPFQTPASVPLHSLWMKIRPYLIPITPPIITTLHALGELTQCHILHVMMHLPHVDVQQSSRSFWGGFSSESFSHVFASRGQGWISAAISATLFCR